MIDILCLTLLAAFTAGFDEEPEGWRAAALARQAKAYSFPALAAQGRVDAHWFPTGDRFWYATGSDADRNIVVVDASSGEQRDLIEADKARDRLEELLGIRPAGRGLPFSSIDVSAEGSEATFECMDRLFKLDLEDQTIHALPQPDADTRERQKPQRLRSGFTAGAPDIEEVPSNSGAWFLGDDEENLYLRSAKDGERRSLTEDGTEENAWSAASASWSPDDMTIFAPRIDTDGVDQLAVVRWLEPVEKVDFYPYPKAGSRLPRNQYYMIDVIKGTTRQVPGTGISDFLIRPIGWRPDGSEALFFRHDRTFKEVSLLAADKDGSVRTLATRRQETFVEALRFSTALETFFTEVGDGEHFLWMSEETGWNHLSLYSFSTGKVRTLTEGPWVVLDVVHVDAETGSVWITGHGDPDRPYDTHLYHVDLQGEQFRQLTSEPGQHRISFSPNHRSFVDQWSTVDQPPQTVLRKADGSIITELGSVDAETVQAAGFVAPEEFVTLAADGKTELHGALFKPADFDPNRKYPVLDYIYNGPFTTWVPREFDDGRATQAHAYAGLGFVVMIVDGRGTPERGKAFQDVVYRHWGQHEIPDHAATLRQLAERNPWMDLTRVGIFGGSWGGYMTLRAMLTHPEVYHAGAATNSVADLRDHAAYPIEGYMGLPQENPEGYANASNLTIADQLQGHLLIAHGTSDVNATFSASMKMVHALVEAGRPHELIVLPETDHWPRGKSAAYLAAAQRDFFVRHLKPWKTDSVQTSTDTGSQN